MLKNNEFTPCLPWPTNEAVFFRTKRAQDLIGRCFFIMEPEAVLVLIGDLLGRTRPFFDTLVIKVELPCDSRRCFLVEVTGMSNDDPALHALPGVRALPGYLQGCLDAYQQGSEHMPTPCFFLHCNRCGEFWEDSPRLVFFREDPLNV